MKHHDITVAVVTAHFAKLTDTQLKAIKASCKSVEELDFVIADKILATRAAELALNDAIARGTIDMYKHKVPFEDTSGIVRRLRRMADDIEEGKTTPWYFREEGFAHEFTVIIKTVPGENA